MKNYSTPRQMRDGQWSSGYYSAQQPSTADRVYGWLLAVVIGIAAEVCFAHWWAS